MINAFGVLMRCLEAGGSWIASEGGLVARETDPVIRRLELSVTSPDLWGREKG